MYFAILFILLNFKIKNRKAETIIVGLVVWSLLGLRSAECGGDILGWKDTIEGACYYNVFKWTADCNFNECLALTSSTSQEVGWLILNWAVSHIFNCFTFFLMVISAVQVGIMGYVLYKNSSNITLSFIIFLCFGLFIFYCSGIRQATAICLVLMAYELIKNKKHIVPFLIILIASSIHTSALVALIAFFVVNSKISKKVGSFLVVGIIAIIPFLRYLVPAITSFLFVGRYQNFVNEGGAYTMFVVYVLIFITSVRRESDPP